MPIAPIKTKTIHGYSLLKSINITTLYNHHLSLFEIDELQEFDMILGEQGLRAINGEIHLFNYSLKYQKKHVKVEEKQKIKLRNR